VKMTKDDFRTLRKAAENRWPDAVIANEPRLLKAHRAVDSFRFCGTMWLAKGLFMELLSTLELLVYPSLKDLQILIVGFASPENRSAPYRNTLRT
jgi:hypothetical protein